jgi:citrate synthase
MSDASPANAIQTAIWREEAEPDNPFAARAAYCRGYDVFGQMVGNARWVEMLFLLFRDELPGTAELDLLETLAVALANPGPRDASVHAAMCGGVGGSTAAASLMAALSVGAGRYGGAREIFDAMTVWVACGTDPASWIAHASSAATDVTGIWPAAEHPPGFDPHGVSTPLTVQQLLEKLASIGMPTRLSWLAAHRRDVEKAVGMPLAFAGVAAAAFADLGFTPQEGEMLYLLLRLPGAAAHALEQRRYGYKRFPFFAIELEEQTSGDPS